MEEKFYKGRLIDNFNLEVVTPNEADSNIVHDIIYQELCQGKIKEESRKNIKI